MTDTKTQGEAEQNVSRKKWLALGGIVGTGAAVIALSGVLEPATAISLDAPISEPVQVQYSRGAAGNYLSGRFAANNGDFDYASLYLSRTLRQDPQNAEIAGYAYRMSLITGEMNEAVELARSLYEANDEASNPEIMVFLSEIRQGEYKKAEEVLARFPARGFNVVVLPLLESWLHYAEGRLRKPVEMDGVLRKVAEFAPFVYYQTALINDLAGFEHKAVKQYEQALEFSEHMPHRVVEVLGNLYTRMGMWDKAKALYARYEKENPNSLLDLPDVDALQASQRTPERVIANAKEGIAEIFFSTASILHNENLNEEALIYVQQVLFLNPHLQAAQLMRGTVLERLERYAEALQAFESLERGTPYYFKGQLRRAYTLNAMGHQQRALELLGELARVLPEQYQVYLTRGDLLMRDKQYAEAVKAYTEALERIGQIAVQHWPIYYARGICAERSDNWELAEADFLKALELQPDQPDVMNYLGYSWLTQKQHVAEAKEMIAKAMEARPMDAHIIDSLGWAHYLIGDYEVALNHLERAIEIMPTDPTVNEHLGDVYWRLGRRNEARFQWQRSIIFGAEEGQAQELKEKLAEGLPPADPLKTANGVLADRQRADVN
ncbi:MAG: tetratricopeptide repeat protein [Rickettsiales bacterium]